jgi:alpha-ribazole phosphatase/probable phosphoglycerate mutase
MSLPLKKTTIDLLRHGEPVGGRKYRGQTDDPLSEKGWRQMREAVGDHCPWDAIVSSSLSRCQEFARELATRHHRPLEVDPRLMEIGFGEWEGRTAEQLEAEVPGQVQRFLVDPLGHRPRGAEPLPEFRARVLAAWAEILGRHAGPHVLVVGHAGIIRVLVSEVLGASLDRLFRLYVPSAGLSRIEIEQREGITLPRLVFHAGSLG